MAFEDVARRMQERDASAYRIGSAYTAAAADLIDAINGEEPAEWNTPLPDRAPVPARVYLMMYGGLTVMLLSLCAAIAGEMVDVRTTRFLIIPIVIGCAFWIRGIRQKHDLS